MLYINYQQTVDIWKQSNGNQLEDNQHWQDLFTFHNKPTKTNWKCLSTKDCTLDSSTNSADNKLSKEQEEEEEEEEVEKNSPNWIINLSIKIIALFWTSFYSIEKIAWATPQSIENTKTGSGNFEFWVCSRIAIYEQKICDVCSSPLEEHQKKNKKKEEGMKTLLTVLLWHEPLRSIRWLPSSSDKNIHLQMVMFLLCVVCV